MLLQVRGDRVGVEQIELALARPEELRRMFALQPLANEGAEESAAAGEEHAPAGPEPIHVPTAFRCASPAALLMSASTIRLTSSANGVVGVQPSFSFAFDASPSSNSTSVGRR